MVYDNPEDRPPSEYTCAYWNGIMCVAPGPKPVGEEPPLGTAEWYEWDTAHKASNTAQKEALFDQLQCGEIDWNEYTQGLNYITNPEANPDASSVEIPVSCYNDGNCNGFGTCRGCSSFTLHGMKLGDVDGAGGTTQVPMNVQVYNLRAQMAPCCNWDGPVQDVRLSAARNTECTVAAAADWQDSFTDDNPTAYPCNGAKPECPYYTGPLFTEVVDVKMDTGYRVTAKQIMELRYYSRNWRDESDPRGTWDTVFEQPEIWAWVRDSASVDNTPGAGRFDDSGNPLIQKVTINSFATDEPQFIVGAPRSIATGTPVVGGPPDYPTLVRELNLITSDRIDVVWPKGTTALTPFVRKTFTPGDAVIIVAVIVHSDNELVAINVTKHSQGGLGDAEFIASVRQGNSADVISSYVGGFPGGNFNIPLEYGGSTSCLNHIKIFLAGGETGTEYITKDIYVLHNFYHAHIAQTRFHDLYGHTMVDPWINHFTRIEASADVLHLTNNTVVDSVLWHTTASNGKKTLYAVEYQEEVSSEGSDITWEILYCGYIAVTFLTPNVNRVYPWKAWGTDSKGAPLYVKVVRSNNSNLPAGSSTVVEMELVLASTAGSLLPPNVAIFKPTNTADLAPFDVNYDELSVRYAYTEYKQGPLSAGDVNILKFPSDVDKIIDLFPYDIEFGNDSIDIYGTFLRAGGTKLYSCDDVVGDCYTEKALENEESARSIFANGGQESVRSIFANGGQGGEGDIKKPHQIINDCANEFSSRYGGDTFEDGTAVSFSEAANRLGDMHLTEGSQHYFVVFKDGDGIPIGVKNVAFLTQSAMVQARDVEIRYKWVAPCQHWPIRDSMFLLGRFAQPMYPRDSGNIIYQLWPYDPYCGDHAENDHSATFRAFDLSIDKHGALWYPYTRCTTPQYEPEDWWETRYSDCVEGFGDSSTGSRRDYWERMRYYNKYTPAILNYIPQQCCCWSKRTTTLDVMGPPSFVGYTKIRSLHPQGPYSTDRESIRVSRHYEKRNLDITTETITQGDGGWTIDITSANSAALYDDNGDLRTGSETQTPVWVHISDGMSKVIPASEEIQHPFGNVILERVGQHSFNEQFSETRVDLHEVMEERDLTRSTVRNPDGTEVYLSDGTFFDDGVGMVPGTDIRWVYKDASTAWVWIADPPEPERGFEGTDIIGGLFVDNPASVIFKKNFRSASHVSEGVHTITYTPHQFDDSGDLSSGAKLSLDGGPSLYISQNTGWIYILASETSPYDSTLHTGEDYQFVLHGRGVGGIGILADASGLQRYEVGGVKYATFAGVNINLTFDIDELPYEVVDIRTLGRPIDTDALDSLVQEYGPDNTTPTGTGLIDLKGHYYVETINIDFVQESGIDIPVVGITGVVKGDYLTTALFSSNYTRGDGAETRGVVRRTFAVKRRLTKVGIELGARYSGRGMVVRDIDIQLRDHVSRSENIFVYGPRVQVSTGYTGSHKPSELEFYFERVDPEFSKDYLSGQLSLGSLFQGITKIAGTEVKYSTRTVKDLIPQFDFTELETSRFPYDNISFSSIVGYTSVTTPAGTFKFLDLPVTVCSKGWTMYTTDHEEDPSTSLAHTNAYPERRIEDGQENIYNDGASLLGDKVAVFRSFWHPEEISFFEQAGVNLNAFAWSLRLYSTVAPIERVFKHESYGCIPSATNENLDGRVHEIENWQARGAFHYLTDPGYNYTCLAIVVNKHEDFLFLEYGTSSYFDSGAAGRFQYVYGPTDNIDKSPGGRWGGPIANPAYTSMVSPPSQSDGALGPFTFFVNNAPAGQTPYERFQ